MSQNAYPSGSTYYESFRGKTEVDHEPPAPLDERQRANLQIALKQVEDQREIDAILETNPGKVRSGQPGITKDHRLVVVDHVPTAHRFAPDGEDEGFLKDVMVRTADLNHVADDNSPFAITSERVYQDDDDNFSDIRGNTTYRTDTLEVNSYSDFAAGRVVNTLNGHLIHDLDTIDTGTTETSTTPPLPESAPASESAYDMGVFIVNASGEIEPPEDMR